MTTAEPRVEGQPAYVLHIRPYRDDSALVDLFTADYGRLRAVARGVRKARSRLRDATQSLRALRVGWRGRGELKTLTAAEPAGVDVLVQGEALWCGLYLNELVMRLVPSHDPQPRLFAYYQLALSEMADADTREPVLRVFEGRLLEELGLGFALDRAEPGQQAVAAGLNYRLDPQRGLLSDAGGPYPGHALLAMAADDYSEPLTRRCAKRLMREALAPLLGDRPLQSRSLFNARGAGQRGAQP
ncbi:DNA repair protein RecO [Motiliproteus sp. SC1-56]|uniref:DNA repair protein RecO n=1 Tax=Motiliproteus sp. SC1-56 TaxID=2799565 RepID=UPI001A8C4247|nr:DNA repair protein RecO [Motiliproteus sp. SC1-56]